MSEFDKEYTSGSSEKSEAVEAFEDFEMSLDDVGSADEIPEVFDVTDVADAADVVDAADVTEDVVAAAEAVEEAETLRENEMEASDAPETDDGETEETDESDAPETGDGEVEETQASDAPETGDGEVEETEASDAPETDDGETEETDASDAPETGDGEVEETQASDAPETGDGEVEETEVTEITEENFNAFLIRTDKEESDSDIDIMSAAIALDTYADNQDDHADVLTEEELSSGNFEIISDEPAQTEADTEKTEFGEEVDEDDYLDYDDTPRPKKIVSGKAALITMLVTGAVTICLIVAAVWMGISFDKDTGVTVVSYSDRFNACDTNSFTLGKLMGASVVSMSDAECSLSNAETIALKRGKAVKKFNGMMNLKANTRFGKIVSMDVSFNPELNEQSEPGITCMMLLGNAMSGYLDKITTSDQAFLTAYKVLVESSEAIPERGDRVYVFKTDDIAIYSDYSGMSEPDDYAGLKVRIEKSDPKYINAEKLDFSWLPFNASSDKETDETDSVSDSDK